MALNNLGLGFLVTAKDAASAVLGAVSDALGGTDKKARELQQTFGEVSGAMGSLGVKLTGIGVAGLAGLGLAANEASKFGAAITEAGTLVSHAQFPVSEMARITKEMARTYGGDLSNQTKALYQGISSGATNAAKAQSLLVAANELAIAGHTDQTTAITGLTKVMNNYGMDFAEASHVSDAFFTAVKGGQTTVGELGSAVGDVAASARDAGFSMDELLGAMGTGATLLGNTSTATTGLKAVIQGLAHPTADATAEAKKLGIAFDDTAVKAAGGFLPFLQQLQQKAGADLPAALKKLFNSSEATTAVLALTANGGKAYADMMGTMATKAGAAKAAFEEMNMTFEQQSSVLKASLQVALVEIGEQLAPLLATINSGLKLLVSTFLSLPGPVKRVLVGLFTFASAAALVVGGLLLLGSAIAGIMAAGPIVTAVLGMAVQTFYVFAAVAAVAAVAVAGFRAAVDKNVGGIGTFFKDAFGKVTLAYDALVQLFEDGEFSGAVLEELDKARNKGIEAFAIQAFLVFNRFKNFVEGISEGFSAAIDAMGPALGQFVASLTRLGAAFGMAQDGPADAGAAFDRFGAVGVSVGEALGGAFEFLVRVLTTVSDVVGGVIEGFAFMGPVFTLISRAVGNLIEEFSGIFATFGDLGASAESGGGAFTVFGDIIGAVAGAVGYWLAAIIQGVSAAMGLVGSAVGAVVGVIGGAVAMVHGLFDILAGLFSGDWPRMWDGAKNVVFGFAKIIVSLIAGALSAIGSLFDSLGKAFGKDLGIKKAIEGGAADALKDLSGALGVATTAAVPKGARTVEAHGGAKGAHAPAGNFIGPPKPPGAAAPAVAVSEGAAASTPTLLEALGMMKQAAATTQAQSPIALTSTIKLEVDGAVLASVVQKQMSSDGSRAFGPTPTAT